MGGDARRLHQGTVALLKQLVADPRYRVIALTNWSAETFPVALERFDFLHLFEGIVVSGAEKIRKPNPEIYTRTLERYQLSAEHCFFLLMTIKAISKPLQHSESKPIIFTIQRDWKTIYANANSSRKGYRLRRYPNQRLDLGRQSFVGQWRSLAGPSSF